MKAALRTFWSRCLAPWRRRKFEREMAEEMRAHLEVLAEEYIQAGMSPENARLAARRRFGGVAQFEEQCREQQSFVGLEQWAKDAAFAFRSLLRARGFTLTTLTMLVLGIGVANIVYLLTAWVLILSQPYPQPEQLHLIGFKDQRSNSNPYRLVVHLQAYREQTNAFSEFAAVTRDVANVEVSGEPLAVNLIGVSPDCFKTLGINPVLGRGFRAEEFQPGERNVVVITDLFWRRNLQADPGVLGRTLIVDQQPCTVIGVLRRAQPFPPAFEGDVYRPYDVTVNPADPLSQAVFVIGRLRPGVPVEEARRQVASVTLPELPQWAMAFLRDQEAILMKPTDIARPDAYWVLAAAGVLLFVIACLNAANLMLVRLVGRDRELGIRLALGGTRWQIARLLLIESVGLAAVACAIVLVLAHSVYPPLMALITSSEAARYNTYVTWQNVACVGGLSIFAAGIVALVPVWRLSRSEINASLKDGGTAVGSRHIGRLRICLVIAQAALAVVLLAGTGLLLRSFERLYRSDLGFDPAGKVKVMITLPRGYQVGPEPRIQLFERLQQKLASLPGVRGVSFGQDGLLVGGFWGTAQLLMQDGSFQPVAGCFVGEDFLQTAGLRLKRGRWLSGQRGVFETVVSESFAKMRFGDEDPVGRSFKIQVAGDFEHPIVGVVADVKETVRSTPGPRFYIPTWVYPPNISTLLIRLDQEPRPEFAGQIRRAIYDVDPRLVASQINSLTEAVGNGMWAERFAYRVLRVLSATALVLAVTGLFSVIAYTVDVRMKEFGVRMAIGATSKDLLGLVLRRGVATALAGVALGIAGALALTRFMQSLLFETTPHDPLVYGSVALVLLVAAVLASWLPARRAARVDITRLLRAE